MSGVYIHIPFCKQLCSYCDFYFSMSLLRKDEMLDALRKELAIRASEQHSSSPVTTLYFGGGTPTVYNPSELALLIKDVKQLYGVASFEELTIEANPDDLTEEYLLQLASYGVNRLSIGIQSFIDRDLKWMNRRHSAEQARLCVKMAQQAGFHNISIDLIYGIPGMSLSEWEYNIDSALALGVQHISAYHLGIEEKTIFGKQQSKGLLHAVDEDISVEQFLLLKRKMEEEGFEHYEISNFAKEGMYGKHNSAYWQLKPYIGIGPSAHSYSGVERRWNVSNNIRYLSGINNQESYFEVEVLDKQSLFNDYLLTALRTKWGVDLSFVEKEFPSASYQHLLAQAQKYINSGKLCLVENTLRIPAEYFFVSDSIIADCCL